MRIRIVTIFPDLFTAFLDTSLIGRARREGLLEVAVHDLRNFTDDPHRSVDDEPYGGGGGMVMTAAPWLTAAASLAEKKTWRVLLSPQGARLDEPKVHELAARQDLLLFCGRYEGIDERVRQQIVDEEISIGDYVLSGGELPAMVLVEAVSRQVPGVVGLFDSVENDSFRRGLLDYPHYTRPRTVAGHEVPPVLLSGHHAEIQTWRRRRSLEATLVKRPDLLAEADLSSQDQRVLAELAEDLGVELPKISRQGPRRTCNTGSRDP